MSKTRTPTRHPLTAPSPPNARVVATALLALGLLFVPARHRVEAAPKKQATVSEAIRTIQSTWREGGATFVEAVHSVRPDRFRVILGLALSATEDREALLTSVASTLEARPRLRAAARFARRWAKASAQEIEAEQEVLDAWGAVESQVRRGGTAGTAAHLAALEGLTAPEHAASAAWGLIMQAKVRTAFRLKRHGEVLRLGETLLADAKTLGWTYLEAQATRYVGEALNRRGRRSEALDATLRYIELCEIEQVPRGKVVALRQAIVMATNLGRVALRYRLTERLVAEGTKGGLTDRQRIEAELWLLASDIHRRSLAAARERHARLQQEKIADPGLRSYLRNQRLALLVAQGKYAESLQLIAAMRREPAFRDRPYQFARDVVGIMDVYRHLGREAEALELGLQAIDSAPSDRDLALTAMASLLAPTAALLRSQGRTAEALALLTRGATIFRKHERLNPLVSTKTQLANLMFALGQPRAAEPHIEEAERLTTYMGGHVRARVLTLRATIELQAGNPAEALATSDRALRHLQQGEPRPEYLCLVLAQRAAIYMAMKAHVAAAGACRQAIELRLRLANGLVERDGLSLRDDTAHVATLGFEAALASANAASSEAKQGYLAEAWWFREAARALLLAATVGASSGAEVGSAATPAAPSPDEEHALLLLTHAQTAMYGAGDDAKAQREAQVALAQANAAYLRLVREREDAAAVPLAGAATGARPLDLADFQARLDPSTAGLAYMQVQVGIVGLAIRHDRIEARHIEDVSGKVGAWLELAGTPGGPATALGAQLYDRLVRPFEAALADVDTLWVLPDGPLAYLPFSALVTERAGDGKPKQYLLDRMAVAYVPSGAVLASLAQLQAKRGLGGGLLAVGAPATTPEHYAPLAGARAEVQRISKLYPVDAQKVLVGAQATLEAWTRAVRASPEKPWRAIHMACHGLVDRERPHLSGLVLTNDHVLSLEHIRRMPLRADLAVLSACDSGSGQFHRGEGVMGLARGFFQAGTPRVVVTAWAVSDAQTGNLMHKLHSLWAAGNTSAPQALREARLGLRRSQGGAAHPHAWAPFMLWGP